LVLALVDSATLREQGQTGDTRDGDRILPSCRGPSAILALLLRQPIEPFLNRRLVLVGDRLSVQPRRSHRRDRQEQEERESGHDMSPKRDQSFASSAYLMPRATRMTGERASAARRFLTVLHRRRIMAA